jgi:hypothetical protein
VVKESTPKPSLTFHEALDKLSSEGKPGSYRKVMKSVKNKFGVELKYNDMGDLYFKKKGKEITHADMKEVQKYIIELVPKNLI